MAITAGNSINAADIAARYTSYKLQPTNGNTATQTLPGNGYVFFTYDTATHNYYGSGIAYFVDDTNGWNIMGIGGFPSTITISINKSTKVFSFANNTGQTATVFLMWAGTNT